MQLFGEDYAKERVTYPYYKKTNKTAPEMQGKPRERFRRLSVVHPNSSSLLYRCSA
jgi:hypothetical protein